MGLVSLETDRLNGSDDGYSKVEVKTWLCQMGLRRKTLPIGTFASKVNF